MEKFLTSFKKVFAFLLLLVVAVCLAGCSEVQTMTVTNSDGTIDEMVYVTLDQSEVESVGYSYSTVQDDISDTSLNYAQSYINSFYQRVHSAMLMTSDPASLQMLQSFLSGVEVVGNEWYDDTYAIGLRFSNVYVYYYYYYGTTEVESSEGTREDHFFYYTITYTGLTTYYVYSSLASSLTEYFTEKYPNFVNTDGNQMLYTYVTDSARLHSDAAYVTYVSGEYYHTWVVDGTDTAVTIYYTLANRGHWILVSIGAALGISLVIFLTAYLIEKHKKPTPTPQN